MSTIAEKASLIVLASSSIFSGLCVFLSYIFFKNTKKNQYGMILLGMIVLDIIIALHFILSILIEQDPSLSEDSIHKFCLFDGYLASFTFICAIAYNIELSHCILKTVKNDNKETSGYIYHGLPISLATIYCVIGTVLDDIGQGIMGSCAMKYGSSIEILMSPLVIIGTFYSIYSAALLLKILVQKKSIGKNTRLFFIGHIVNMIVFSLSWIPAGYAHISSFTSQLSKHTVNPFFLAYIRVIMMAVGLINSIIRLFADPYIKHKLFMTFCMRNYTAEERREIVFNDHESVTSSEYQYQIPSPQRRTDVSSINTSSDEQKSNLFDTNSLPDGQPIPKQLPMCKASKFTLTLYYQIKSSKKAMMRYQCSYIQNRKMPLKYFSFNIISFIFQNMRSMFAAICYHFSQNDFEYSKKILPISDAKADQKTKRNITKDDLKGSVKYFTTQGKDKSDKNRKSKSFSDIELLQLDRDTELSIQEYRPSLFQDIRFLFGVQNEDVVSSFNPSNNYRTFKNLNQKKQGRSGKQILFTQDKRFLVKEIDHMEKYQLLEFCQQYHDFTVLNQRTLLAKVFGLFSFKINNLNKMYFIVMQNLDYYPETKVMFRYDLKFSEINRRQLQKAVDVQQIKDYLQMNDAESLDMIQSQEAKAVKRKTSIGSMVQSFNADERPSLNKLLNSSNDRARGYSKTNPTTADQGRNSFTEIEHETKQTFKPMEDYQKDEIKEHLMLLKDLDFQNLHKVLKLSSENADELKVFIKQILADTQFLCRQNIMDYSLLLLIIKNDTYVQGLNGPSSNIARNPFTFTTQHQSFIITAGIIDYLQIFNFSRNIQGKAQRLWQAIKKKNSQQVSCVEPIIYFNRFNTGVLKIFEVEESSFV